MRNLIASTLGSCLRWNGSPGWLCRLVRRPHHLVRCVRVSLHLPLHPGLYRGGGGAASARYLAPRALRAPRVLRYAEPAETRAALPGLPFSAPSPAACHGSPDAARAPRAGRGVRNLQSSPGASRLSQPSPADLAEGVSAPCRAVSGQTRNLLHRNLLLLLDHIMSSQNTKPCCVSTPAGAVSAPWRHSESPQVVCRGSAGV